MSNAATRRTLFVRGLTRSCTEEQFRELFKTQEGILKTFLIKDKAADRKRHKGIGFAEFDSTQHASSALDALNGTQIGDRELKVGSGIHVA